MPVLVTVPRPVEVLDEDPDSRGLGECWPSRSRASGEVAGGFSSGVDEAAAAVESDGGGTK